MFFQLNLYIFVVIIKLFEITKYLYIERVTNPQPNKIIIKT